MIRYDFVQVRLKTLQSIDQPLPEDFVACWTLKVMLQKHFATILLPKLTGMEKW